MPTLRRVIALLIISFTTIPVVAQPAASDPGVQVISLDDAIKQALARNFAIKVQGYDAAIAAARVTESLGKFDPVLTGTYNYSENFSPALIDTTTGLRGATSGSESDTYDLNVGGVLPWGMTYRLGANSTNSRGTFNAYADNFDTFAGVSGTQPLLRNFGFGPTLASIRIAQANRGISEWQFKQQVMSTVTRVIFAYNDLNFALASQRSAKRSRELAAQLVSENEKRLKVGAMSEYEVTSARSRLANREESILFAERSVRETENALKQLITDDKTTGLLTQSLTIEPPPTPPVVVVDAAADFRVALDKRPDYQQAKLALKRDSINSRLALNQMLPRVDLVGSYGYNGYDVDQGVSRRMVRNQDYLAYSWGVVVSVPLTFTTERGRYRAARFQRQRSETELDRVEQGIVVLVGNAAGQVDTALKRIQASRQARELAQYTLDAEVKRLRAGTSTTFFVAQQQETLSGAEVNEARAQADYAKALADYDLQLGLTLEKLGINVDPPK